MGKLIDITGCKFGRLLVLERAYVDTDHFIRWKCLCDCGNIHFVRAYPMKHGEISSCGCLEKENLKKFLESNIIHGLTKTPIYRVWKGMKRRCYSISDKRYLRYGGRGISVCNEWIHNPSLFIEWSNNNGYKQGLTIDRINNDGNYEPTNCRFVSVAVNNRNSSNTHLKESDIEQIKQFHSNGMMQIEIAPIFGITQQTVSKIVNNKSWKL